MPSYDLHNRNHSKFTPEFTQSRNMMQPLSPDILGRRLSVFDKLKIRIERLNSDFSLIDKHKNHYYDHPGDHDLNLAGDLDESHIKRIKKCQTNKLPTHTNANEEYLELVKTIKRSGFDSILGLSNNFLI
jgi:hypothetical protein